jgi:hypothetical protein
MRPDSGPYLRAWKTSSPTVCKFSSRHAANCMNIYTIVVVCRRGASRHPLADDWIVVGSRLRVPGQLVTRDCQGDAMSNPDHLVIGTALSASAFRCSWRAITYRLGQLGSVSGLSAHMRSCSGQTACRTKRSLCSGTLQICQLTVGLHIKAMQLCPS